MLGATPKDTGTIVAPFPSPLVPLRAVKATLLIASVQALKATGHFEAYYDHLDAKFDDEVLNSVAGTWVSVDAAHAHYAACDALALTSAEQMAVGSRTGDGLKQHITRFAALISRSAGLDPWLLFEQFNRFWARSFEGGGICVTRLGPKDAEVVYARCSLLASSYFRSALRGVALGLIGSITRRSLMLENAASMRKDEACYRLSWV